MVEVEPVSESSPITISIYQNAEYVEGILQQAYQRPLLTDFSQSSEENESDSDSSARVGESSVRGSAKIGGFGAEGVLQGGGSSGQNVSSSTGSTYTSNSKYTQSYYLHAAIRSLRNIGAIKEVSGADEARGLRPGDFVIYSAEFRPSQLISILDIATPDLVERIVHHFSFKSALQADSASKKHDQKAVLAAIARAEASSGSLSAIARAATEALRIDFRSPNTREYYGQVGTGEDAVTAVTICDVAHFVVEDEDRILDGEFSVIGKVISRCEKNEPILSRNKILDRINPQAIDEIVQLVNAELEKQSENAVNQVDAPLNMKFDSRVPGASFKVIPIAVFL